jgi:nucleotide-binding universal stress UspA family protein
MPLLKNAEKVQVLEIREKPEDGNASLPDTSIAAALGHHGIKPIMRSSYAPDISAGDEILSRLADEGADLLVMGAYGHSRVREFILGGVTRHIARHMTAPTLWSH